jgi:glutathione S-transferase
MTPLTLYVDAAYESPYALSAFVALEEKQLPYAMVTKRLSQKETFNVDYRARTKRVPALQHGDFWLAESLAIAEYLAEAFPFPQHPRLFPTHLEQRATARELQHWVRSDLLPLRTERPTTTLWGARATTALSAQAVEAATRLVEGVEPLLAHGRPTLFEHWCLADLDLALMLQRLNLNGSTLPPKLKTYAETNWQRPSAAKWHALNRTQR